MAQINISSLGLYILGNLLQNESQLIHYYDSTLC